MTIDDRSLASMLGLAAGTHVEREPLTGRADGPELAILGTPGDAGCKHVVVRQLAGEAAENHVAVLEALGRAGFTHAPRLLGIAGCCAIEEWVAGVSALSLAPPEGSLEAAMDVIAALHRLDLREGLRWEVGIAGLLPEEEFPLHRLGFAAHERGPAREPLAAAREALLSSTAGFMLGAATADRVLLRPGGATLVSLGAGGFGLQLFDVAAFLLTAGIEADRRGELAMRYASARDLPAEETAGLADLAALWWGLHELLVLPRRQVMSLGDENATYRLNTAASRIERGIRQAAGSHALADAIRAALWPSRNRDGGG